MVTEEELRNDPTPIVGLRPVAGVPQVQCQSSTGGDGVVPGENPSNTRGRTIIIEDDPENPTGERLTLVIEGPNDPDIIEATQRLQHLYNGLPTAGDFATAVYREAATAKQRRRLVGNRAATPPAPPVPTPMTAAPVGAPRHLFEPPPREEPLPPPPAPPTRVAFLHDNGGSIEMEAEEVVVVGDTLVLVSGREASAHGLYTPPRSVPGALHPLSLAVEGVDGVVTAFMLHSPYAIGGRRHLVLAVDG